MGYLDNSTITVDAILTKRGRELLAQGRGTTSGFNITRFALADDEVDYDLWNPAHPLGSDYYGAVIENMPITEAVPDETQSMKYKLITLPRGIRRIPYLQADKASVTLATDTAVLDRTITITTYYHDTVNGNVGTLNPDVNPFNQSEGYSVLLMDNTYVKMEPDASTTDLLSATVLYPGQAASSVTATLRAKTGTNNSIKIVLSVTDTALNLTTTANKTTKLIITGVETGGRVVIPITINGPQTDDE